MRRTSTVVLVLLLSVGWLMPSFAEDDVSAQRSNGMDIKFEDVEVTHALRTISKVSGLAIAVELGLELDGQVDLTWSTADWRDGVTRTLGQVGLTWDETAGYIIVKEVSGDELAN